VVRRDGTLHVEPERDRRPPVFATRMMGVASFRGMAGARGDGGGAVLGFPMKGDVMRCTDLVSAPKKRT